MYDFDFFCVLQKMEIRYKRTNVEIDLDLVQEVMATYKRKSIKEAVNFSLQKIIEHQKRKKLLDRRDSTYRFSSMFLSEIKTK